MRFYGLGGFGVGFGGWGGGWDGPGDGLGGYGGYAGGYGQVHVLYRMGFETVPEPIQRCCAEVVKVTLERLKTDTSYQTISGGNEAEHWSKTVRASWQSLPDWCRDTMGLYKDYLI